MSHSPLFDRSDFEIPDGVIHVCNGAATPFLRSNLELWHRYASLKEMGGPGRVRFGFHGFNDLTEVVRIAGSAE